MITSLKGIPLHENINSLHEITGSHLRTDNPLFHCFNMEESNDLPNSHLGPHRANFYTLALSFGTKGLSYSLNEFELQDTTNFILCVAPGQIATWEKKGDWHGYCTFFKSEFLAVLDQVYFLSQYPFFNISETNVIPLSLAENPFKVFLY